MALSNDDPLTQTLALLRPRALLWKQLEASGDWALRFPANSGVVFSLIAAGACVFASARATPRALHPGDFLLMASPPDWTLGATAQSVPTDVDVAAPRVGLRTARLGGGGGPVTRLVGGHFVFADTHAALLQGLLPEIVEIRAADAGATRLRGVLDLIGDEAAAERPGRTLMLERLLEIMLVEVIRRHVDASAADRRGLLAGLADPQLAAALRALHADIARRWTVAELARRAGLSRSVFAERFCKTVGVPPFDYLLQWRMAQAKDLLRRADMSLGAVAGACGYRSVSAFSTAFTRSVGQPPSRYAAGEGGVPALTARPASPAP